MKEPDVVTRLEKLIAEIDAINTERAALIDRQQALETALGCPLPAAELIAEYVTLGARIKAQAVKLLALAKSKQEAIDELESQTEEDNT